MSTLWAVLLAVAAGASFAIGAYLQQDAASKRPEDESLSPKLLGKLATEKRWVGGIALDFLSYAFKAGALAFGPLLLVQPVLASNLIIAVPLSLRRHKLRIGAREWGGIALVAGGLVAAILFARPAQGQQLPSLLGWGVLFAGVAVVGAIVLAGGRRLRGTPRASAIAVAAAVLLATQGALLQATVMLFKGGIASAFTSWEPYAMAVASIGGLLLVQSAYQAGPLAASMPVIDVVNPLTAIAIGLALFGESIATGTLPLLGTLAGLGAMVAGIVVLDTSPTVHQAHRQEKTDQAETEEQESDEVAS